MQSPEQLKPALERLAREQQMERERWQERKKELEREHERMWERRVQWLEQKRRWLELEKCCSSQQGRNWLQQELDRLQKELDQLDQDIRKVTSCGLYKIPASWSEELQQHRLDLDEYKQMLIEREPEVHRYRQTMVQWRRKEWQQGDEERARREERWQEREKRWQERIKEWQEREKQRQEWKKEWQEQIKEWQDQEVYPYWIYERLGLSRLPRPVPGWFEREATVTFLKGELDWLEQELGLLDGESNWLERELDLLDRDFPAVLGRYYTDRWLPQLKQGKHELVLCRWRLDDESGPSWLRVFRQMNRESAIQPESEWIQRQQQDDVQSLRTKIDEEIIVLSASFFSSRISHRTLKPISSVVIAGILYERRILKKPGLRGKGRSTFYLNTGCSAPYLMLLQNGDTLVEYRLGQVSKQDYPSEMFFQMTQSLVNKQLAGALPTEREGETREETVFEDPDGRTTNTANIPYSYVLDDDGSYRITVNASPGSLARKWQLPPQPEPDLDPEKTKVYTTALDFLEVHNTVTRQPTEKPAAVVSAKQEPIIPQAVKQNKALHKIIMRCLSEDQETRPTMEGLLKMLAALRQRAIKWEIARCVPRLFVALFKGVLIR